jgi:hypothetical protein
MTDLGSIGSRHERQDELYEYCATRDRWSVFDLERVVRDGRGDRHLPIRVRYHVCGEQGQLQIRAPMPTWPNANG